MSEDTAELIDKLSIPEENRYVTGTKEFEDAFEPEDLHNAWIQYLKQSERTAPKSWSIENIAALKEACDVDNSRKFSRELRTLSVGSGKKMTKPIFGGILAKYCNETGIPESIKLLLKNLENA